MESEMRDGQFFNIESTMAIESGETGDSGRVWQRMPRPGDVPVCLDHLTVEDTAVRTSSSHVLVVDHDMNLCRQLSDYLGKNDFQVTTVNTGKQMLELIRREGIDLLLLEPGLPGEDGLKLTKAIRDSSSMPLVVAEVYDRTIDVQIGRLRRKIEADSAQPRFIRTERGAGYYFDAAVSVVR
jgi:CheY-like chemotaxis protein